jgi:hypothetical protein
MVAMTRSRAKRGLHGMKRTSDTRSGAETRCINGRGSSGNVLGAMNGLLRRLPCVGYVNGKPYAERSMNDLQSMSDLRAAIFKAFAELQEPVYQAGMSEQDKRASHLDGINDVLNGTPLAAFSSQHLALLELMIAYWRELEVEREVRAPGPDAVN